MHHPTDRITYTTAFFPRSLHGATSRSRDANPEPATSCLRSRCLNSRAGGACLVQQYRRSSNSMFVLPRFVLTVNVFLTNGVSVSLNDR